MPADSCDTCERPWVVLFAWSYTGPERYCLHHLLTPIEGQPGETLLDFFPDCQRITHRPLPETQPAKRVQLGSTAALQLVLTGRVPAPPRRAGAQA